MTGPGCGCSLAGWRKSGDVASNLAAALLFDAAYWLSQMAAFLFPGVSYSDPEFVGSFGPASFPPQLMLELVLLLIASSAAMVWTGRAR